MRKDAHVGLAAAGAAVALALAFPAGAVSTSFWRVDSYDGFAAGDASAVSVLEEGALGLSPRFERVEVPDAGYVWAAAPGPHGQVYLAAGTPGRLYAARDGDLTLLFEETTADLPALAVGFDGDAFVGTAPGGQVYRVTRDGESSLFFDTGQGYVWSMAYSTRHGLLVGTGASGTVFLVDEDGNGSPLYESTESSITTIACLGDRVLAGTSGEGLLLDITPGREARILFDSGFDEVSAVVPDVGGDTYFASTRVSLGDALEKPGEEGATYGEGQVWRTTPAGGAVGLWDSPDAPVTSLGLGPSRTVWAGTGSTGCIFTVGPRGRSDLIADLEEEEILSITAAEDDVLVTTGVPGALYRFGRGIAGTGTYASEVLSAGAASVWGEMRWRADAPGGAKAAFATRSGNTSEPDATWSDWEEVEPRSPSEGPVASPPAQYLQWRVTLSRGSSDAGPVLRSVEVAYLRENLPPRLVSVVVSPPGEVAPANTDTPGRPDTQTMPGWLSEAFGVEPPSPKPRDLPALVRGLRMAEWEVVDPNDDRITFDVWLRGEGEEAWKVVKRGLTDASHTFDTQALADGLYRIKVVATDEPDNPRESAGRDSVVSAAFLVDGTPPSIGDLSVGVRDGRLTVRGSAADGASPVERVTVAVDYGEWKPAFADDGMFDSLIEAFRLDAGTLEPGEHAVAVRATDGAGNSAVATRMVR